jgi:DNA polymerase IV
MERRVIGHLDMDAFYVSVELLRRPELRGKPVIIAGHGPRAVVTTASYEARRFGVGSAMPASRARRLCPDGVYLPVDMNHYREASAQVMGLISALEAPCEAVSLDEVYLDLSTTSYPVREMSELVRGIREQLGLDASVGIGPNKLVAKVASDAEKPRGFVVLSREQAAERFGPSPPGLIPGIGPKTVERLGTVGVETIAQLQSFPVERLVKGFGPRHGRDLHDRAHFRSDSPVAQRTAKSRSVETTFDTDVTDIDELERVLRRQAVELAATLQARGRTGRTIAIKLRYDDFQTLTRARTIPEPTADAELIAELAVQLLRANRPTRPVRLAGVRVGSFDEPQSDPSTQTAQTALQLDAEPAVA